MIAASLSLHSHSDDDEARMRLQCTRGSQTVDTRARASVHEESYSSDELLRCSVSTDTANVKSHQGRDSRIEMPLSDLGMGRSGKEKGSLATLTSSHRASKVWRSKNRRPRHAVSLFSAASANLHRPGRPVFACGCNLQLRRPGRGPLSDRSVVAAVRV